MTDSEVRDERYDLGLLFTDGLPELDDQAGYRGCWVLNFSGGYAPRIFNANGTAPITEVDAVKPGSGGALPGSATSTARWKSAGSRVLRAASRISEKPAPGDPWRTLSSPSSSW